MNRVFRERKRLVICAGLALLTEIGAIFLSNVHITLPASHRHVDETPTEVEVIPIPEEAPRLKSESAPEVQAKEETIAEKASQKTTTSAPMNPPASNQIAKGRPMSPTHGAVLIESPAPVIPDYLKNHDLSTKVLIEFTVLASGAAEPRLLVSSGDEELDQIALNAAKKWKFYPAETNHEAIVSKVRLRINFSVK